MKTSELKLHKRNPRQIGRPAMDKLKDSIERDPEFMKLRPIVVDESNTVLGGNQRLRAIRELGYKDIPDEWVKPATGMDTEKLRRFMLIDNLPMGEWDIDILSADFELPELEELGFNLGDLGLDLGDGDIPGDEIPDDKYQEQYGVIVMCESEGQQEQVFNALVEQGYVCKVVVT